MKQVIQNISNGETLLIDVPCPQKQRGHLLIATQASLVSAGTERMLVDFGKANWIDKARQQPDKVKMVLDKVRTDGLMPTVDAVRSKLDQPIPLGYCNAGVVMAVGDTVFGFEVGDRVVSNGPHAGIVSVPRNLCARIPAGVDEESAAFTVLGAVGLQGVRLAEPTLGETFVVTGLGLVGLMTVQILRANGCRVLGIDFDDRRLELARNFGAETVNPANGEDPLSAADKFSRGRGVDGVLITASTKSSDPVHQAAQMCRKRGRIVLVGVTGLELSRADFYEKELSFQVSCSYGPGRYDINYEDKGQDYPLGFVRWTEQRNFEAILDMMADGSLDVKSLISHRFDIEDAANAYHILSEDSASLGILLAYSPQLDNFKKKCVQLNNEGMVNQSGAPICGFIGAGNYASRILIPAFKKSGAVLETILTQSGINGVHHGKCAGFSKATTDSADVMQSDVINTVVIASRHNSHAAFVIDALQAGKNVFVEKPLAITHDELNQIESVYRDLYTKGNAPHLMVGFNRRFAPHVIKMKKLLLTDNQPKSFVVTVNAGNIPAEHWTQDSEMGGGRIIGESCHFVDLLRFLSGSQIVSAESTVMESVCGDTASIQLRFEDGSIGSIHYFANGNKGFPKERVEVFCGGRTLQLDNFRSLKGWGWDGFRKMNLIRQDKGQVACVQAFLETVCHGGQAPISFEELLEVSRTSIDIAN